MRAPCSASFGTTSSTCHCRKSFTSASTRLVQQLKDQGADVVGALTHGNPDSAGVPASFAAETIVIPYNDRAALDAVFAANPGQIAGVIAFLCSDAAGTLTGALIPL